MGTDPQPGRMGVTSLVFGLLLLAVNCYNSSPYTPYTSFSGADTQGEPQFVEPQSVVPGYEYYDDIVNSPTPGNQHTLMYRLLPMKDGITGERNKRGAGCMRRCLRMQMLHPARCNSLC